MEAASTLALNLAYLAGGLLLGFIAGSSWAWAERHDVHQPPPRRRMMRLPTRVVRGVAYLLVGLLAFGTGVYVGFQTLQVEYACVNDYANDLADSLEPRQQASETLQRRQSAVFKRVAALIDGRDPDGRKVADALDRYLTARDALEEERAQNPYPQPPREVCQ